MSASLRRHTSMRGRLALLLILLLVLPMSLVGLLAYHRLSHAASEPALPDGDGGMEVGLEFALSQELTGLRTSLDSTLADFAVRVFPNAGQARTDVEGQFTELGAALHPTHLAILDGDGRADAPLPPPIEALARDLVRSGAHRKGYALLAEPGLEPQLWQVAYGPRPGGGGLLAVRVVVSDGSLLDTPPSRSPVERSLVLGDGTILARSANPQSALARRTSAAPSSGVPAALPQEHRRLLTDPGSSGDMGKHRDRELASFSLALHDLAGRPVALLLVQGLVAELAPDHDRPAALLSQVRSLLGWIALTGVLLAIAIGVLAPRWVWSDIRDATDSIFYSVERLRELVKRNSRALDEQSQVMKTLTASASSLKLASQSIADTTRALAHSAEQSAWVSQSGNRKAELSQRAVVEVRDRVEQITSQMEELERRCADIGKILGFIDHLSNETNTLSINATIQAAGAGSEGRQFSVVASEIRKLADLALQSTRDIQQLIEQIQESSRTTLSTSHEGCREVDKCLQSFDDLESAFSRILQWVDETTRGSHGIEQSTARQSDSLQSVVQSIEQLEQRASETAGNFHEVVAAADELARLGADMNETWRVG